MKLLLLATILTLELAHAKEFHDLIQKIMTHNHELKAKKNESEHQQLKLRRFQRHWHPKIQTQLNQFQTNDPSAVLFNRLGGGVVTSADFNPTQLNDPGLESFTQGTLALDLPLYEGAMRVHKHKMQEVLSESTKIDQKVMEQYLFSTAYADYAKLLLSQKMQKQTEIYLNQLNAHLRQYEYGQKNNPLGRSGLLGFKSLINKINILNNYIKMNTQMSRSNLKAMLDDEHELNLKFNDYDYDEFIKLFSVQDILNNQESFSKNIQSEQLKVKAFEHVPEMEKARLRPQVGVFARNDLYSSDRDSQNVQTIGLYLKWDLYNADSYSRDQEARLQLQSYQSKIKAFQIKESKMRKALSMNLADIKKSLNLFSITKKNLDEQVKNLKTLFQKGRINALQLVEVYDRQVDLLHNSYEHELKLLALKAEALKLNSKDSYHEKF